MLASGLSVKYGTVGRTRKPRSNIWKDHGRPAWRIHIEASSVVLPMPFVRKQDAEMALMSIAEFTDWSMSKEQLVEWFSDESKRDKLRRLMVENLAW